MGRVVLFVNGEIKDYAWHREQLLPDDEVIAVDGGGRQCLALGIVPALAIGDFDSLGADVAAYYRAHDVVMETFPTDKDDTDFALALRAALTRGAKEILVLGALGGPRLDMEIGNIFALIPYYQEAAIVLLAETSSVRLIGAGDRLVLAGAPGDYLSLLPLTSPFITGKSRHLRYQLEGLVFTLGETRGTSNEFTDREAIVTVAEGMAILICQKRDH